MLETHLFKESPNLVFIILVVGLGCSFYSCSLFVFFVTFVTIFLLMLFYRSPDKLYWKLDEHNLYSPAYGKIMDIQKRKDSTKIAIFLSVFDIHVQFIPFSGKIIKQEIKDKGFFFANNLEKSMHNVKLITHLQTKWGIIKIKQMTGFFVRRLVTWVNEGDFVKSGDNLGMIKFGSRVDIEFPSIFNLNDDIKIGKYVNGKYTTLGKVV
jgi:phosphatidylserine decarboxylase